MMDKNDLLLLSLFFTLIVYMSFCFTKLFVSLLEVIVN